MQKILVTGSSGFVGKNIVNALLAADFEVLGVSNEENKEILDNRYIHRIIELTDCLKIEALFEEYMISHVIHLAAIAHTYKGMDNSWSRYYRINTLCSKTLFNCAAANGIPVFFASTVDVYGIIREEIDNDSVPNPIGNYARSKFLAEEALKQTCSKYTIARFAPIYSDKNKTDIQKRYYLRYPDLCYIIGKGKSYEFLSVDKVAALITDWCSRPDEYKNIIVVSDDESIKTRKLIDSDRQQGRAKSVIYVPVFVASAIKMLSGCNRSFCFKFSKILDPIKITKMSYLSGEKNG